jgi:hypothetical protein
VKLVPTSQGAGGEARTGLLWLRASKACPFNPTDACPRLLPSARSCASRRQWSDAPWPSERRAANPLALMRRSERHLTAHLPRYRRQSAVSLNTKTMPIGISRDSGAVVHDHFPLSSAATVSLKRPSPSPALTAASRPRADQSSSAHPRATNSTR